MSNDDSRRRFEAAYDAHLGEVLAYARRRADAASAEDAVAEAFLTAWRRRADMPDEPLAWLLTITRNVLANQHRGESRRLLLTARLAAERPDSEAAPTPGGLDEDLIAALRRIPADDRELLCLLAWERLSREQAARVLGCRPAALRLRLHRARRRLERELDAATPGRLSRGATRTPTSPAEGDPT